MARRPLPIVHLAPARFRVCALVALAAVGVLLGCAPAPASDAAGQGEGDLAQAGLGEGWVVWESNRSGAFRIWIRPLAGGPARQLSPEETGRDHCCPHLSPDGAHAVWLSLPGGLGRYAAPETNGVLHLIQTDGRRDRVIAPAARHYGEHRAAVWWSADELAVIDGSGDSRLLDLSTATDRLLARGPARGPGWLIDPTGRWATSSTAHFSSRDPVSGAVRQAPPLGGCQAWVAADGEVGVWTAGAGGPIDAIELATRRTWTVLAKGDPRLPADCGYLYFPMLARDRSLLALAASSDQHDHFRADYDLFLIPIEPATLRPQGSPVRVTEHPAVDRFPDLWRAGGGPPPTLAPPAPPPPQLAGAGWPAVRSGLVLVWEGEGRPNRTAPDAPSELLLASGDSWTDRRGRLALAGGSAATSPETAARVGQALRTANTATVELVVEPASLAKKVSGVLLALGSGPRQRGLWVGQAGSTIELRVRTNETGPGGGRPATLARLPDPGPHHLAFTYSPGRLRTYLDGELVAAPPWAGDFLFAWRARELTLGSERGSDATFRGFLSHLALFARELSSDEVAAEAERALAALATGPAVASAEVEATLRARSRVPTLDEISPYRRALVVEEWRLERVLSGSVAGPLLRVARWSLLDGRPTAAMALAPEKRARLRLEPFAEQPQLESDYLSDTLPVATGAALWFATGID